MKSFRRKKRGEDIEEVLASIPTNKKGCETVGGNWDPKAKKCDLRQLYDKSNPNEIVTKKFDRVERVDESENNQSAGE